MEGFDCVYTENTQSSESPTRNQTVLFNRFSNRNVQPYYVMAYSILALSRLTRLSSRAVSASSRSRFVDGAGFKRDCSKVQGLTGLFDLKLSLVDLLQ